MKGASSGRTGRDKKKKESAMYVQQQQQRLKDVSKGREDFVAGQPFVGASPGARRRAYRAARHLRECVVVLEKCWTEDECKRVSEALQRTLHRLGSRSSDKNGANAADNENGWQSARHARFSTIDLPAFDLSARAYAFVQRCVRKRVIEPFAQRCGLDAADLFLKDLFFVIYDAENPCGQRSLDLHHDGSLFSFNLLLNHENEFSGGGTYFPELGALSVKQGDCVVHDGKALHGGAEVTSGTRLILVGFVQSVVSEEASFGESAQAQQAREMALLRTLGEREAAKRAGVCDEEMMQDALMALSGFSIFAPRTVEMEIDNAEPVRNEDDGTVIANRIERMPACQ